MKKHPYFLKPEQHRLAEVLSPPNSWVLIAMLVLLLLNEILVRPMLPIFKNSPSGVWPLIALTINGQIPLAKAQSAHFFMIALSVCYFFAFLLLPKWGKIARVAVMKKSLPDQDELKEAIFFIETPLQNVAFQFWYRLLMRLSLLIGIILPCMVLNMFRSAA